MIRLSHRQRQALATQQLIVDAARDLFLELGYGATTIEAISDRAGVAVSTVYSIFKNKRGLLAAVRESWHQASGQRDIYQLALAEHNPAKRLELAARATRRQWESGADMFVIYNSAAAVDLEAAAERDKALAGRQANLEQFIQATSPMLHPGLTNDRATAIYLTLTRAELYQELVENFGWSPDEYEIWLADLLKQQLLP